MSKLKSESDVLSLNELKLVLLLAAIQFAHILDFVVIMPLGPTLMDYFQISPAQFALLASSYNFSAAISGIFFGTIADRFDRKVLLNCFFLGFIVGTFLCAMSSEYEYLLASRVLTGCFGGIINAVVYAIVPDLIPYERRGRAMGIIMSAFSVASVVGVPLGVAISDYYSWKYSFAFIGIFSFFIFIPTYFKVPSLDAHIVSGSTFDFVKRYGKVFVNKRYTTSFILIFLASGSMFMLIPFLSPYAVKNMKIDLLDIKYAYLIGGAVTIVTARIFGKLTDQIGGLKLFFVLCLASFIPVILFTHSGEISRWTYFAIAALFMSLVSGRMIPCFTLITEIPDGSDRGSFMSVLNSVRSLGSALFSLIGGLIIVENATGQLINYDKASYLSIVMGLVTIFLAFDLHKKLHKNVL
jgi:predicted MFS family arabinose efflux permease